MIQNLSSGFHPNLVGLLVGPTLAGLGFPVDPILVDLVDPNLVGLGFPVGPSLADFLVELRKLEKYTKFDY